MAEEARRPFIERTSSGDAVPGRARDEQGLTSQELGWLCLLRLLSTWTSQTYMTAAALFIRAAFTEDASSYFSSLVVAEILCTIPFTILLGRWISQSNCRLTPLLWAVVIKCAAIVLCCVFWPILLAPGGGTGNVPIVGVLTVLGGIIRLSQITNTLCIEREWIPALATPRDTHQVRDEIWAAPNLTRLNAILRGIVGVSAFLAPLATLAFIEKYEPTLAALFIGIAVSPCMAVEVWTARWVWKHRSSFKEKTQQKRQHAAGFTDELRWQHKNTLLTQVLSSLSRHLKSIWSDNIAGLHHYLTARAWLPSLCTALMHGSVLSLSDPLAGKLVMSGFSSGQAKIMEDAGHLAKFGAVIVFLVAVLRLAGNGQGKAGRNEESYQMVNQNDADADDASDDEVVIERNGDALNAEFAPSNGPDECILGGSSLHAGVVEVTKWAVIGHLVFFLLAVIALVCLGTLRSETVTSVTKSLSLSSLTATMCIGFLTLSFLGRWTFDLAVLQLSQTLVPTRRAEFGGAEEALSSCAELMRLVSLAVWRQEVAFRWLTFGSLCVVAMTCGAHVWWTSRWKRGHS